MDDVRFYICYGNVINQKIYYLVINKYNISFNNYYTNQGKIQMVLGIPNQNTERQKLNFTQIK